MFSGVLRSRVCPLSKPKEKHGAALLNQQAPCMTWEWHGDKPVAIPNVTTFSIAWEGTVPLVVEKHNWSQNVPVLPCFCREGLSVWAKACTIEVVAWNMCWQSQSTVDHKRRWPARWCRSPILWRAWSQDISWVILQNHKSVYGCCQRRAKRRQLVLLIAEKDSETAKQIEPARSSKQNF